MRECWLALTKFGVGFVIVVLIKLSPLFFRLEMCFGIFLAWQVSFTHNVKKKKKRLQPFSVLLCQLLPTTRQFVYFLPLGFSSCPFFSLFSTISLSLSLSLSLHNTFDITNRHNVHPHRHISFRFEVEDSPSLMSIVFLPTAGRRESAPP